MQSKKQECNARYEKCRNGVRYATAKTDNKDAMYKQGNKEASKWMTSLTSTSHLNGFTIATGGVNNRLAVQLDGRHVNSLLLLLLHLVFLLILVVTPLIFCNAAPDETPENANDQNEPKDIDGLEGEKQGEGDDLRDPAFVLLGFPVQFVGTDGAEFSQDGPEDVQIQVVAEVEPDADESYEVRACDGRVEVVEDFGGLHGGC